MTEPGPGEHEPSELDKNLQDFLKRAHRTRWALITAAICLFVAGFVVLGWLVFRDQARLEASCDFYRDVASIPLSVNPPKGRQPSQLGVGIVLHARFTFNGQGCPGDLPPAGAGLIKWASYYHLPRPPR